MYQKSQEELLSIKQYGPQWVEQLERELAHKESTTFLALPTNRLAPIIMDQAHNGIMINDETFDLRAESFASGNLMVTSPTTTSLETVDTEALLSLSLGPLSNAKTASEEATPRLNCSQCGKSYKNYSSLLRHTWNTHEFEPTKCPYNCDETFDSYGKLNWHIRHHHKPQFSTRCTFPGRECKRTFTLWSRYSIHIRKDHKLSAAETYQYDPRDSKKRSRRLG